MTLFAVEGPAGSGKTCRLMSLLSETLAERPLNDGQKVLALTFMHGARRRLNERLRTVDRLRGRFDCLTIDSFAWKLLKRWRSLAGALTLRPPQDDDFDAQCEGAGVLLERPEVCRWVSTSYPVVLVDEAQDLKPQRLRIIRAVEQATRLLVAADEFQCLDTALRPNPFVAWIHQVCRPQVLNEIRRTEVPCLLQAAGALRRGAVPVAERDFRIIAARGIAMAAAYLANAIAWRRGGNVAIITPSLAGNFSRDVLDRVCHQACGAQGNGPYSIHWDRSDNEEVGRLLRGLELAEGSSLDTTLTVLANLPRSMAVHGACTWAKYQARAAGKRTFCQAEIEAAVTRHVAMQRQRFGIDQHPFTAMTVQQAKNREFEGVVVLWPFTVGGDAEQKRRLLYNAITRAKRWCTVIVQSDQLLAGAPFR